MINVIEYFQFYRPQGIPIFIFTLANKSLISMFNFLLYRNFICYKFLYHFLFLPFSTVPIIILHTYKGNILRRCSFLPQKQSARFTRKNHDDSRSALPAQSRCGLVCGSTHIYVLTPALGSGSGGTEQRPTCGLLQRDFTLCRYCSISFFSESRSWQSPPHPTQFLNSKPCRVWLNQDRPYCMVIQFIILISPFFYIYYYHNYLYINI